VRSASSHARSPGVIACQPASGAALCAHGCVFTGGFTLVVRGADEREHERIEWRRRLGVRQAPFKRDQPLVKGPSKSSKQIGQRLMDCKRNATARSPQFH
jgi:hypothetical protein